MAQAIRNTDAVYIVPADVHGFVVFRGNRAGLGDHPLFAGTLGECTEFLQGTYYAPAEQGEAVAVTNTEPRQRARGREF
jgi:hypothetical protein